MHYVFSGDQSEGVVQSMMYPPTTAGFSSTNSDCGDLPLNMHADDDMMEEDEDEENEAEVPPHRAEELSGCKDDMKSASQDKLEEEINSRETQKNEAKKALHDDEEIKVEKNPDAGATNDLQQEPDTAEEGEEEETTNVLKHNEGKQGKTTNQSTAEDEIRGNNVDIDGTNALNNEVTIDQS